MKANVMFNNSMNLIVTLYFDKVVNLFVYSFRYPSYKLTNTTCKSTSTSGKLQVMILLLYFYQKKKLNEQLKYN